MRLGAWLTLILIAPWVGCSQPSFHENPPTWSNVPTIALSGCGNGVKLGYLFCQLYEGQGLLSAITVRVPKVDCKLSSCIEIKVIGLDGGIKHSVSIPNGSTEMDLLLFDIINDKSEIAQKKHDGEYRILARIRDIENETLIKAYIRINIAGTSYNSISCDSPMIFNQSQITNSCSIGWTHDGRSILCGNCY